MENESSKTKLSPISALLKRGWEIYQNNLRLFLGIELTPILLITVSFLFTLRADQNALFIKIGSSLLVCGFFIELLARIALLHAIQIREERIGIIEAYRFALRKIMPLTWLLFVAGLIVFGGFLFFFIPGILFIFYFSLAPFVLIAENEKGVNALLKSWEYVKGNLRKVFLRFLVIYLFAFFTSEVAFLVGTVSISGFLRFFPLFLTLLFLTPYIWTYLFLIYDELKAIRGEFVFVPSLKRKVLLFLPYLFMILLLVALGTERLAATERILKKTILYLDYFEDYLETKKSIPQIEVIPLPTDSLNKALRSRNISICEELQAVDEKDGCIYQVIRSQIQLGTGEPDFSSCFRINDNYKRGLCMSEIAVYKKDLTLCEQIEEVFRREMCIAELAEELADRKLCYKVTDDQLKNTCLANIAIKLQDPSACEKLEYEDRKDYCYSRLSWELEDESLCGRITSTSLRESCHERFR